MFSAGMAMKFTDAATRPGIANNINTAGHSNEVPRRQQSRARGSSGAHAHS